MTGRDDIERLIARVALGDRAAFDALYQATSAKLFGVCLRVLGERAEAEEALQDVYLRIWQNAGRYKVNGLSPMTWLITVARNLAIDRLRARRSGQGEPLAAADAVPDPGPTAETAAVEAAEGRRLVSCLKALDPPRGDAVRGAYLEGASYEELAARFDVPLNTMRTWLRRSLLKLRECLGP